jgi:hypothetical protein
LIELHVSNKNNIGANELYICSFDKNQALTNLIHKFQKHFLCTFKKKKNLKKKEEKGVTPDQATA